MNKEKTTIEYWRHPTEAEIKFGEGAIHWLTVDVEKVKKPNGQLKNGLSILMD